MFCASRSICFLLFFTSLLYTCELWLRSILTPFLSKLKKAKDGAYLKKSDELESILDGYVLTLCKPLNSKHSKVMFSNVMTPEYDTTMDISCYLEYSRVSVVAYVLHVLERVSIIVNMCNTLAWKSNLLWVKSIHCC